MSCIDQQMKIIKQWELLFGVFSSANNSIDLDYFVLVFQSPRDPGVGKRCRLGTHGEFTPCDLEHDSVTLTMTHVILTMTVVTLTLH